MKKDFTEWHKFKSCLEENEKRHSFNVGEIWWCSIGANVGSEEDGKNVYFERPVLIVRKFNKKMFWALPLTSKNKNNPFYYTIRCNGEDKTVILSQLRTLSPKRLQRRIGKIDNQTLVKIKQMAGLR